MTVSRSSQLRRLRRGALSAAACSTLLLACNGAPPPEEVNDSTSSMAVSQPDEATALRELTRSVAMALSDKQARHHIGRDMHDSQVKEHKLELRSYLSSPRGKQLLQAMSAATGRSPAELQALVAAVRPLEFYMPVRQHRLKWTGNEEVLVASFLEEEDAPVAYSAKGEPVSVSADAPPETPTLSLVPVETRFPTSSQQPADGTASTGVSRQGLSAMMVEEGCSPEAIICDPCMYETCYGPAPTLPPKPPGLFMTRMVIRNSHEPWLRGDPELDLIFWGHLQGTWTPNGIQPTQSWDPARGWYWDYQQSFYWNPNALKRKYIACAGERAADWRYFNFDSDGTHTPRWGSALLAETGEFSAVESITDPNRYNMPVRERRVNLAAPLQVEILERDDGTQCPSPPKYYEFDAGFRYNFQTHRFRTTGFSLPDLATLLGGNNDRVAIWWIGTIWDVQAMGSRYLTAPDADITLSNQGFNVADLPPEQDPLL